MKTYVIEGGIGKNFAFSVLLPYLVKDEPINILTGYPQIFQYNKYVKNAWNFTSPIYKEIMQTNIIYYEPYWDNEFIHQKRHLIESWANAFNIKVKKPYKTEFVASKFIQEEAKLFALDFNNNFIIVQFLGAQSIKTNNKLMYDLTAKNYPLKLAQQLINLIKKKYPDLIIVYYGYENEYPELQNVQRINNFDFTLFIELLKYAKAFISIDSSLQHFSLSCDTKGVVLWGSSPSSILGYDKNINLTNKCPFDTQHCYRPYPRDLGDYTFTNEKWYCPNPQCININPELIIQYLDELLLERNNK